MVALDGSAIAALEKRDKPATGSRRGAMDWDGVRVFLAIAREGSMRAAGRALGQSQPTKNGPRHSNRAQTWDAEGNRRFIDAALMRPLDLNAVM